MGTTVVLRQQFDILMALASLPLALNAEVRKVDAVVDVGQLMIVRPTTDLLLVAVRTSVAIRSVTLGGLEKLLILPLQVLFEDDASDLDVAVLVSKPGFLFAVGGVQGGIVVELARAVDACVERLGLALVAVAPIGLEQVAPLVRENDPTVVFAERDGPDQPSARR